MKYTPIEELYAIYLKHPTISKDTRQIEPNCIYFALKGDNFDGNKFAKDALSKGAAYAVIDDANYQDGEQYILVENSLQTLQDLARFHRSKLNIPVIGITGSNGKTTSKELIATVLDKGLKVHSTKGNYNNHIGVPLTLLQINPSIEIAVIEMGANHQGEIDFLCNIADPDFGLITNIGKAHIEGFGGVEGIKKGKSELYRFLSRKDGKVFINNDDEVLKSLLPAIATIRYGKNAEAYCEGVLEKTHPTLSGSWSSEERKGTIRSKLYGEYNFYNILAAICIGNHFQIKPSTIDAAISEYESKINRSQKIVRESATIYLDAYNANPTSMALAIENFEKSDHSKRVAILGDMFELGEDTFKEHQEIVKKVIGSKEIERMVFVGQHFYEHKIEKSDAYFFKTTEEAKHWFQKNNGNAAFLIKGSRGMQMEKIME